jgi:hypothetical protein
MKMSAKFDPSPSKTKVLNIAMAIERQCSIA